MVQRNCHRRKRHVPQPCATSSIIISNLTPHRRPGDFHVHYFGACALSFGDSVQLAGGDVMQIYFAGFGRALRNPLHTADRGPALNIVKTLLFYEQTTHRISWPGNHGRAAWPAAFSRTAFRWRFSTAIRKNPGRSPGKARACRFSARSGGAGGRDHQHGGRRQCRARRLWLGENGALAARQRRKPFASNAAPSR